MTRRAPVYRWQTAPTATGARHAIRVGELSQHAQRWEFVYDPDYLALGAAAWELDPTFIRNKQRSSYTRVGTAPPPVFCDIALSGWSLDALRQNARTFLTREAADNPEPWGWWERLIYAPADGFGALFVGDLTTKPPAESTLQQALQTVTRASLSTTSLDSSSGAMGGERPKIATFVDEAGAPSKPVLLKFALPSERPDSVLAEATALSLARQLGMNVPGHGVRWFNDTPALCIDRFDRAPVQHCVSAATALDLVPGSDVEDRKRSYVQLRSKLKHPHDPAELFKRIVFNAVVGNTDDHPWNTSLRQVGLGDWALSPLYDVMPFFARSHRPAFRMAITRAHGQAATLPNLVQAGHQIAQLREDEVRALIEHINAHVHAHWQATFEQHAQGAPQATVHEWQSVFECAWLA